MKSEFRFFVLLFATALATCLALPARAAEQAPYRLTLQEAIQKGLQANLGVLVAGTRVEEAEAARLRSLSAALLPRVNAQTYANVQNRDLRAFEFCNLADHGANRSAGGGHNHGFARLWLTDL